MKRETYKLDAFEATRFDELPPLAEKAFEFWRDAAAARGLDPKSVLCNVNRLYTFTALPMGHGRHWCWPMPLGCLPVPREVRT